MPIYMKVLRWMGGFIKGDVTEPSHKDWIKLESAQLGVHRVMHSPRGASREASAPSTPSVQEIVITKHQDVSSDDLFKQSLWGTGTTIQIDFAESQDGEDPLTYLRVTLVGALFASYSVSGAGATVDSRPVESISISVLEIIYESGARRLIKGEKAK